MRNGSTKESARERITRACMDMLNTTSLEALRTQDLIERARVSRSTFYRFFPDKYEVANGVYKRLIEDILQEMPSLKDWKKWSYVEHDYMRAHKQFFRNIASYRGQNSFEEYLHQYYTNNILRARTDREKEPTETQRYAADAFSLIAARSTIDWILNDFSPDDDTMIRLNEACIPPCIRSFYE